MSEIGCTLVDLLRHGETAGGSRFCGSLDVPLTPRGWRQMLAAVADTGPWDAIVSSPLSRCADFARALAPDRGIRVKSDDRLREMHFGAWEGYSAAQLMAAEPEALTGFWNDPTTHPPPGAETFTQFQARTLAAWDEVLDRYRKQRVLLVTHGGIIRVILCHVLERPLSHVLRMEVAHASVHRVRVPHPTAGGSAELLRACERICCARDLAFRRCSGSSCVSIYTPVARLILETRPFGACAPFRSRRNGPALRRNATSRRSRRFFHKL